MMPHQNKWYFTAEVTFPCDLRNENSTIGFSSFSYLDSSHFSEFSDILYMVVGCFIIIVSSLFLYLDSFPTVMMMNEWMKILTKSWVDKEWVFDKSKDL